MAYRIDNDLSFLGSMPSDELSTLVEVLIKDKDGNNRLTEEITQNDLYKKHNPDHQKYWHLIAAEIQCFGANTFATIFRGGEGVLYKEVLQDVCDKLKVNYSKNSSIENIEQDLLLSILQSAMDHMTPEELKEITTTFNINPNTLDKRNITIALQAAIKVSGFAAYKLALIIANTIAKILLGHGLKLATNAAITRTIGVFSGPIGWAITGVWTAADIAGPAYRITIPAVIQVAYLRAQKSYQDSDEFIKNNLTGSQATTFPCISCQTTLRAPKGKLLDIKCPNCGQVFRRQT